jgi:hypothetical protein
LYPALIEAVKESHPIDQRVCQRLFARIAKDGRSQLNVFVPLLLPLTFDEKAPYNFGYDAFDPKELPLASHAFGALMNLTQDQSQLEAGLRHADWRVRNASASLISRQANHSTNTIRALVACLQDTNSWVRLAAAVPLVHVPGYEGAALSNFLAAIPDRILPPRLRAAAISLAGFPHLHAENFSQTVPVLTVAAEDPDPSVRDRAQRLLSRINAPPAPAPDR